MKLPKTVINNTHWICWTIKRIYFSILKDFLKIASHGRSFPLNLLPPAAITTLSRRWYSPLLSLETEFWGFISSLSHHPVSLSTGTWYSSMHGVSHMEPTWFYKQSPPSPSPLHFTVLDSRCYLSQMHPSVGLHVPYCLLNPSLIISKANMFILKANALT